MEIKNIRECKNNNKMGSKKHAGKKKNTVNGKAGPQVLSPAKDRNGINGKKVGRFFFLFF